MKSKNKIKVSQANDISLKKKKNKYFNKKYLLFTWMMQGRVF